VNTELKLRKRMRMRETKVMERLRTLKPKPGLPEPKQKLPPGRPLAERALARGMNEVAKE